MCESCVETKSKGWDMELKVSHVLFIIYMFLLLLLEEGKMRNIMRISRSLLYLKCFASHVSQLAFINHRL